MPNLLNLRDAKRIWYAGREVQQLFIAGQRWIKPNQRVLIAKDEDIGVDGHSFLALPAGYMGDGGGSSKFPDSRTGEINLTFAGFSSLELRWSLNGPSRTADYTGALFVTEFADPSGGSWPAPSTSQGQTTLQYLYWWAMLAQRKGCKAMFVYPPHSPEPLPIDANILSVHQYYVDWLRARPEITIPIYMMPNTAIVRNIRNHFAGTNIFRDDLHLRNEANFDVTGAIGLGLGITLDGIKPAYDPAWNADFRAMLDIVDDTIKEYECTGFGGSTVITPWAGSDPLPYPVKDDRSLFLNNAASINGLNVTERTHNGLYATETGGRRCIAFEANLPVGTRVQADVTFTNSGSGGMWIRTANTADLGPTETTQLAMYSSAGTYSLDATITAGALRPWFGFLTNTAGSAMRISNFRVTYP